MSSSAEKTVLLFSYYWPPAGGPGVQRFLKFTKYLGRFGWKCIVVTPKDGGYPYYDYSLEKEVDENTLVFKTDTTDPFKLYNRLRGKKGKAVAVGMSGIKDSKSLFQKFAKYIRANYFVPDARVGWNKHALKKGMEIIKEYPINLIITTAPPHSSHLIGKTLKKKYNIPWIADFRDPWTNIYYNQFLPRSRKTIKKDKALENSVLQEADLITTVSAGLKREFEDRAKEIEVIFNGYDEVDIYEGAIAKQSKFTLSYIGNFKPNQNVSVLWKVLSDLIKEKPELKDMFSLKFVGNIDENIVKEMRQVGLSSILDLVGFVDHLEATQLMYQTNLLLFVIPKSEHNRSIITGKIFEYLACNSPMLSIGPEDGDAAAIIQDCERDSMIDYKKEDQIKKQILYYYNEWVEHKTVKKHVGDKYKKYTRLALTEQLAKHMNHIVDGK